MNFNFLAEITYQQRELHKDLNWWSFSSSLSLSGLIADSHSRGGAADDQGLPENGSPRW